MNIRQSLSENPRLGIVAGGVLLLVACIAFVNQARSNRPPHRNVMSRAYFTVDDGTHLFTGAGEAPPFLHDGREAVKAMVYSSNGGRTRFVAYLVKFNPDAKQKLDAMSTSDLNAGGLLGGPAVAVLRSGMLVKKPGADAWVSPSEDPEKARQIMHIDEPAGAPTPEIQLPD